MGCEQNDLIDERVLMRQHNFEPWSMKCRRCELTLEQLRRVAQTGLATDCVKERYPGQLKPVGILTQREPAPATRRTRIYIAGPMLTSGNPYLNVRRGLSAATTLMKRGFVPFVPHLTALWEIAAHEEFTYEDWLAMDFEYIDMADALLRLDGDSRGADREVQRARERGIAVYNSLDTVIACERSTRPAV